MTDISTIKGLLDWQLLKGSHAWPGSAGGTCINEAAIVVAGFDYKEVAGVEDLPASFSRELGMLLLCLNDALSDRRRQKLKRFVLRLPGSKDRADVEGERLRSILTGVEELFAQYRVASADIPALHAEGEIDRVSFAQRMGSLIATMSAHRPSAFLDAALDIVERAFDIGRKSAVIDGALVGLRLATARELRPV